MRWFLKHKITAAIILLLMAVYTGYKIQKMFKVRGWIPGAQVVEKTVTNKAATRGKFGKAYWIAWDEADIRQRSHERINLQEEKWETIETGDSIEIVYIEGDRFPYLRDGIFASDGNIILDFVLLFMETAGAAVLLVLEIRKRTDIRLESEFDFQDH